MRQPQRGDIFLANLDPVIGSEQGKTRPVLIIQNDIDNRYSPVVIIAAITSRTYKGYFTEVKIPAYVVDSLTKESVILANQIRTIDKRRLKIFLGKLPEDILKNLNEALMISMGLIDF